MASGPTPSPKGRRRWAVLAGLCTLLLGGALLVLLDGFFRHGVNVDWYAAHEGRRVHITRTVEHRPQFHNERRPLERYLTYWDERKLGLPNGLPLIDARVYGQVHVPDGPPRSIQVDASGNAVLRIDGRPVPDELTPGTHRFSMTWRRVMQNPGINWDRAPDVHFRLQWLIDDEPEPPTPSAASEGPDASTDGANPDSADAGEDSEAPDGGDEAGAEQGADDDSSSDEDAAEEGATPPRHQEDETERPLLHALPTDVHRPAQAMAMAGSVTETERPERGAEDSNDAPPAAEGNGPPPADAIANAEQENEVAPRPSALPAARPPRSVIANAERAERPPRAVDLHQWELSPERMDDDRKWVWTLGLFLVLLFAGFAAATFGATGAKRARRGFLLLCMVLTGVALPLRAYEYNAAPDFRENMDELFAMWNGWQLIENGTTRGWSLWDGYYGPEVQREPLAYWRRFPTTTIQPYFEHPPLFHLMAGAAVHLGGAEHYAHAKHAHARLVPIALSIIALWLTIALALRLAGRRVALLAGFLHATLPIINIQSRITKGEALVAVLLPATVLFFLKWRDGQKRRHLFIAAACAGTAALAKLPAYSFVIALSAMCAAHLDPNGWPPDWRGRVRRAYTELKPALFALLVGTAFSALVLIVAATDWHGFWRAQSIQATIRLVSPDALGQFFYDPAINHNRIGRAFLVFLWIGTAIGLSRRSRRVQTTLALPLVVYTVALALPAGTWHYGWYFLPLYPLLCVGAALMLRDLFERPGLLGGLIVVGLLTLYAVQLTISPEWFEDQAHWRLSRRITWGITLAVLAPIGAAQVFRHRYFVWLARGSVALALLIYVGASAHFTLRYDETSRSLYDYDWGKPGVPVLDGRRDPLDGGFELRYDVQEPEFSPPPE